MQRGGHLAASVFLVGGTRISCGNRKSVFKVTPAFACNGRREDTLGCSAFLLDISFTIQFVTFINAKIISFFAETACTLRIYPNKPCRCLLFT
jgi:hypothetical protein